MRVVAAEVVSDSVMERFLKRAERLESLQFQEFDVLSLNRSCYWEGAFTSFPFEQTESGDRFTELFL